MDSQQELRGHAFVPSDADRDKVPDSYQQDQVIHLHYFSADTHSVAVRLCRCEPGGARASRPGGRMRARRPGCRSSSGRSPCMGGGLRWRVYSARRIGILGTGRGGGTAARRSASWPALVLVASMLSGGRRCR
jgi:hypothetical protein